MAKAIAFDIVEKFITENLGGVVPQDAWGERSFFYNPGQLLKRGTYFATLKQKDGDNDKGSNLDRDGVWRLNFGVQKNTFKDIFGLPPTRPAKGCTIEGPWDFTELDMLMPHPVYGWMSWMAVNNPSQETWEMCKPLITDAHAKAKAGFEKRTKTK